MADTPLTPAALRPQREAAIARLIEHFARDHIEADDLERLIDGAHHATTPAEIEALFQGLPALTQPTQAAPNIVPRGPRAEQQAIIAVMGGAERRGVWAPARKVYVTAIMGGAVLDFRDAELPNDVTEVFVLALMGGVEIIVPPGIAVDSSGMGIMGGFDHGGRGRFPVDATGPVLRISGLALMGGVEIRDRPRHERGDRRVERQLDRQERRRLEQGEPPDGANWGGWDR